jgi:hypothetical protein
MSASQKNNLGQIAMEFLMVATISIFTIFTFLIIVVTISQANTEARTYDDIIDLGRSLQQELLLASELEDGYLRELDIPSQINGETYTITIYDSTKYTYMIITYLNQETFYAIPPVDGGFHAGKNMLYKNGTLYLN